MQLHNLIAFTATIISSFSIIITIYVSLNKRLAAYLNQFQGGCLLEGGHLIEGGGGRGLLYLPPFGNQVYHDSNIMKLTKSLWCTNITVKVEA